MEKEWSMATINYQENSQENRKSSVYTFLGP